MAMINDNSDSRSKLEDEIKKLETVENSVAKPTLPAVTLKQMSYDAPSDEYLKIVAERSLDEYKTDKLNSIRESSANDEKTMTAKRDAYVSALQSELAALDSAYASAARGIDNDVIKRGLARSSIAATEKAGLESEYLAKAADTRNSYGKQISELDGEISAVGAKLQTALDEFNLAYAVKLSQKLDELKAERDKKATEALKYNNDIAVKQAQLDANRAKTESDLYTAALNQKSKESSLDTLSEKERDDIYEAVYAKMDEYLSALSSEQARKEVRNHTLYRDHLSDYYYYKLYDKYGR
ncbi:MAG: hypothetical protein NC184_04235 [Roseburia sp.]|nr:hypothetical protein [Roseburia sp.]